MSRLKQLNFLIDDETRKKFKIWCYENDVTPSKVLNDFINEKIGLAPSTNSGKPDGRSRRTQSSWDIHDSGVRWEDTF
jgi:hypothetical protein